MMKHLFRHIFTTMLAASTIASCSDETSVAVPATPDAEVYISIDMTMPSTMSGARSSTNDDGTSTDGTEAATAEECAIKSMLLVFTSADDNTTLLHTLIGESAIKPEGAEGTRYTASTALRLADVTEAIAGKQVNLYVLANPLTGPMGTLAAGNFNCKTAQYNVQSLADVQLSTLGALPMSNADTYSISGLTAEELSKHISADSPLILNTYGTGSLADTPLSLERSVARIDYKDGSPADTDPHTYPLGKSGYTLQVESLQLINVSKSMYCLRHTSTDGNDANTVVFGTEKKESGYVMDTDAPLKHGNGNDLPPSHFIMPEATSIPSSIKTSGDYYFWTYVTENTIPSADKQLQGYSTGIKFHTRITGAPADVKLDDATSITINYQGEEAIVNRADDGGFYIDYYYFIQHNDNNVQGVMGPMEYAIVRNNIYRLSLESIDALPRPYDPEKPDEDDRITLQVRVKKWGYHKIIFDM